MTITHRTRRLTGALAVAAALSACGPGADEQRKADGPDYLSTHTTAELCDYPQQLFKTTLGVRPDIAVAPLGDDPDAPIAGFARCTWRGDDNFTAEADLREVAHPSDIPELNTTTDAFYHPNPAWGPELSTDLTIDGSRVTLTRLAGQGLDLRVEREGWRATMLLTGPGEPLAPTTPEQDTTTAQTLVDMLDALRGA